MTTTGTLACLSVSTEDGGGDGRALRVAVGALPVGYKGPEREGKEGTSGASNKTMLNDTRR